MRRVSNNLIKKIQNCLNNLKNIQEKAKYVKKNKKLSTKIKNYTAFMTETLTGPKNKDDPENETSDDDEECDNIEVKAKRAAKKSADFFDSDNENSSDEDSSSHSSTVSESKRAIKKISKECDSNNNNKHEETNGKPTKSLLKNYNKLKQDAVDFKLRYCGHCNVATDIKEANFLGE